jgi:hypothetical protein
MELRLERRQRPEAVHRFQRAPGHVQQPLERVGLSAASCAAVVDTNSRTGSPGRTLTRSANPSVACSGPG